MLDKPVKITLDIRSISFKNKERRSDVEVKQCLGTKSFIMHIAPQNPCVCPVSCPDFFKWFYSVSIFLVWDNVFPSHYNYYSWSGYRPPTNYLPSWLIL